MRIFGRTVKALRKESGQAVIFVALSLTGILGFVGFATDVGMLLHTKRNLQIAADSAAMAGAHELNFNPGNVQATAQAAAAQNGIIAGSNGATVTVHNPPSSGPHANPNSVEVIVTQNQPTFFMRLFSLSSMTVGARAVAFNGVPSNTCLNVLNPTAGSALDLSGTFSVSMPGCGIIVNSTAGDALNFGGAGTLAAQTVGVVGGASGQTGSSTPPPITGVAPVSDPLASLPAPSYNPSSCTAPPASGAWGPPTAGGTVCYSGNLTISNTTLNPGVYVFTGNISFNGTVSGTGVTFYLLGGLDASNGTLALSAPTSGTYNGILIFGARINSSLVTFNTGNATGTLSGIIYLPNQEMELSSNSAGLQLNTDLIVNTLIASSASLSLTNYSQTVSTSPLTSVALVE